MSKHRVLSLKPQLRLEWRGQDGQNETEQPDHAASLGDSITSSTRIRFSLHTPAPHRRSCRKYGPRRSVLRRNSWPHTLRTKAKLAFRGGSFFGSPDAVPPRP